MESKMFAVATITKILLVVVVSSSQPPDLSGDYCRGRQPLACCPHRDDDCSVPILGTLCYCDVFCNRTANSDCCPDFWHQCTGIPPPQPKRCHWNGRTYIQGVNFKDNCNTCTCRGSATELSEVKCDESPCLIRPELIAEINRRDTGWKASNYSSFWGKTLSDGIRYRLGTHPPTRSTKNMPEIQLPTSLELPEHFDSRQKWVRWIQPIRDQGDCGSSWAFSSAALASDRLAIMSGGLRKVELSPQLLISCQIRRQEGCSGGHLDRAWWFLRKHGTSSESCFPYASGQSSKSGPCLVKRLRPSASSPSKIPQISCIDGKHDIVYLSTPPYRTASKEDAIMQEIYQNGPVQATFRVKEDFYSYRAGIYRYSNISWNLSKSYRREGWHSVRIIGWGKSFSREKGITEKYWLCANSWGEDWGEEGYFRILRGSNECDIESFVIGVWANLEEFEDKKVIDLHGRRGDFT